MEHTALPWRKSDTPTGEPMIYQEWRTPQNVANSGGDICTFLNAARRPRDEIEANAEFIIKCCNAYESMVELLRSIHQNGGSNAERIRETLERAGEVFKEG